MFRLYLFFILPAALILFSGCQKTVESSSSDDFSREAKIKYGHSFAELERSSRLWKESRTNYYDFDIAVMSAREAANAIDGKNWTGTTIKIREGKTFSITKNPKAPRGEISGDEKIETIEKLFDLIKEKLDKGRMVEAQYDQRYGFPERIVVLNSFEIEDKTIYEIKNFDYITPQFHADWKEKYQAILAEINKNRLIWQENKIGNYDFICKQFQGGMYLFLKVQFKVRDGLPFSLETPEVSDLTLARMDDYDKMGSFENMFDFLEQELNNERVLTVKYNKLGYPQDFYIEYSYGTHGSRRVEISKFEIIK